MFAILLILTAGLLLYLGTAATIPTTVTSRTIADLVTSAQAALVGGDTFANTGRELLYITNGGSGDITLTVATNKVIDGVTLGNRTYTIPHTGAHPQIIGPFGTSIYNDANGYVDLTYSGVTSVTVAVLQPGSV